MAIKKSDLYSSIWASCDELRGGMDASQYKDYVLFMLFIKYISDKYGDTDDFAPPVVIPSGASFSDMVSLKGRSDIGDRINTDVVQPLIDANSRLARSDFPDFNDPNKLGEGQAMVDRLTNLIGIFQSPDLDFSKNRAEHDDILGDAYEYLMRHFATQSGRSKGQFYTPAEVSRVIAQVVGISPDNTRASTTVYDPTCGSGSLLLKVAAEARRQVTLEGQEKDVTTAGLARMNMILHDFPTANIVTGNTLAAPKFKDEARLRTYDYVVANPPFSDKTWTNGLTPNADPFQRFVWGVPPQKNGDYAYLLHVIRSMKSTGKGACILPHGVLFRGNAEALIRRELVTSGILKGIIGLPENLFYGTQIAACILVLDKENAAGRRGVFVVDASKGFRKDGPKNRLREQDIHRIVDTFTQQADVPRYARLVSFDEIATENEYVLNLPRYIDTSEPNDLQDIDGHLRGGIPSRDLDSLDEYWKVMPALRDELFESAGRDGYFQPRVPNSEIKRRILEHPEFASFRATVAETYDMWKSENLAVLRELSSETQPQELMKSLSESILHAFESVPLIDPYAVYQHLMDYWTDTMQDDVYLVLAAGWLMASRPRQIVKVRNKDNKLVWAESHEFLRGTGRAAKRFKSDLVPSSILIERYLTTARDALTLAEHSVAQHDQLLSQMVEEEGEEDGLLAAVNDDGITKTAVKDRLREIEGIPLLEDEYAMLNAYADLVREHEQAKEVRKEAEVALNELIDTTYAALGESEVVELVVEDKWLTDISTALSAEVDLVSQTLANRVLELADRYEWPLPALISQLASLSDAVDDHVRKLGVSW